MRRLLVVALIFGAFSPALLPAPASSSHTSASSFRNVAPHECVLLYFYRAGCDDCARVNKLLQKFESSDPHLQIIKMNIMDPGAASLNEGLCTDLKLPPAEHGVAPSLFGASRALIDTEITSHSLLELIHASRGKTPPWADARLLRRRGKKSMKRRYDKLTPVMVVGAGLADGINPCAFAVIIFFLTYMTYVGKTRKEIVLAGLLYTAAVFLTYLAIGVGLHQIVSLDTLATTWFRRVAYIILIGLLLLASALSIRDALTCRRGNTDNVRLKLPDSIKRRIRLHITRHTRRGITILGALSLGVLVALLEFPCTGQIYIPIITYLSVRPAGAFGWLLLYNFCFILPLIIVFLCVLGGTSSDTIKKLFQRHLAKSKFAMAGVFFTMALILMLTFP